MSCECRTVCNNGKKVKVKGNRHQLKRKISSDGIEKEINIYPITLMDNIIDSYTGKRLSDIMFLTNHIRLEYNQSFENTIKTVPKGLRRYGLYVTVTKSPSSIQTFIYTGGTEITCVEWTDPKNWVIVFDNSDETVTLLSKVEELRNKVKELQDSTLTVKEVTKEEYDKLPSEKKTSKILYYITNA